MENLERVRGWAESCLDAYEEFVRALDHLESGFGARCSGELPALEKWLVYNMACVGVGDTSITIKIWFDQNSTTSPHNYLDPSAAAVMFSIITGIQLQPDQEPGRYTFSLQQS